MKAQGTVLPATPAEKAVREQVQALLTDVLPRRRWTLDRELARILLDALNATGVTSRNPAGLPRWTRAADGKTYPINTKTENAFVVFVSYLTGFSIHAHLLRCAVEALGAEVTLEVGDA
jgi:hypothetical protein